ncbi:efflux RND transporter permease subunit [Leptospira biflexa]|uniref:efflux RND transporter permease subunit n=1 Tax=Leptospira biflexa TaxID=172 RepID=UPI0010827B28|nr:efflux RND transporter permease subunit [Leptospira biflexa]TGM35197.1 efflux RND transporter permease subunit [Leptospira biflexa]TGM38368.1 efflux RND transporter permease subunit [Leptospira biflexa]
MNLIDPIVRFYLSHNRLCWVGLIFIFMAVFFRLDRLKVQLLPNLTPLKYFVTTPFPNHSAEDVDLTLSLPMSNRISSVNSVKGLKTNSVHGKSTIEIELQLGASILEFKEELYQLLSEIRDELPNGVGVPKVMVGSEYRNPFFEFTVNPNLIRNKSQISASIDQLRYKIERISGVIEVIQIGDLKPSLLVSFNESKLNLLPLKVRDLEYQITAGLQTGSLGKLLEVNQDVEIKFDSEIKSLAELQKFPIHLGDGKWIPIESIADVSLATLPSDQIIGTNGEGTVYFGVLVDPTKDPLKISNQILHILKENQSTLHPKVFYDSSRELKSQINQFVFFLIISLFSALVFSYLSYKEWLPVICLFVSVIFSLVYFFHLLVFFSLSINLLSLSGISVGIGMLFDANNLIYYSIQSSWKNQKDKLVAVSHGIRHVIISLFSSGFTTMVVIFPLLFYVHEWQDFFYDIGLSIVLLVFSSLLTSVTVVPLFVFTFAAKVSNKNASESPTLFIWNGNTKWKMSKKGSFIFVLLFGIYIYQSIGWDSKKFQIFPKPNSIGKMVQFTPKVRLGMNEERFFIQEIRNKFKKLDQNLDVLILPILSDGGSIPHQFAIPFLIKWFSDGNSNIELDLSESIDPTRWNLQWIDLPSELFLSLPFVPYDSVVVSHDDLENLIHWEKEFQSFSERMAEGRFAFLPSPITLKTWKSIPFLNSELSPDLDDLKLRVSLTNVPNYIGMVGIQNPMPIYFEFKNMNRLQSNQTSNLLPNFKSASKESIFPDTLFQMEEKQSYSEFRRESGRFYLEWIGDWDMKSQLTQLHQNGFHYVIRSEKKEMISFFLILMVLLVCSFLFIYLTLVGIFESFFRPAVYLMMSILYSFVVISFLFLFVSQIHFGHYMGLVVLIGLSLDSISLFGERWEETKNIHNISDRINHIFTWMKKPVILNAGSTFFGLLPVVMIPFPGSEFVRAIAVTICIGILVSAYFVFKIYPIVFSKYLNTRV